jgi:hypothetical protein
MAMLEIVSKAGPTIFIYLGFAVELISENKIFKCRVVGTDPTPYR